MYSARIESGRLLCGNMYNVAAKVHVYYSGTALIWTPLGQAESVLISGVIMYRNMTFGAVKAVLFIEVSSLWGVLIRGVPLYSVQACVRRGVVYRLQWSWDMKIYRPHFRV